MEDTFPKLIFPFVYLDGSFLHRANNVTMQKLTRKLLSKNPKEFHKLLDELIAMAKTDHSYYKEIIQLQQKNVISTVVTYEALSSALAASPPTVIPLFGNINKVPTISDPQHSFPFENLVLWGENVKARPYFAAAMAILNSPCVVADDAFLSLSIGRSLVQYVTSDCVFYNLKYAQPQDSEDKSTAYQLPPEEFIRILHSQL